MATTAIGKSTAPPTANGAQPGNSTIRWGSAASTKTTVTIPSMTGHRGSGRACGSGCFIMVERSLS